MAIEHFERLRQRAKAKLPPQPVSTTSMTPTGPTRTKPPAGAHEIERLFNQVAATRNTIKMVKVWSSNGAVTLKSALEIECKAISREVESRLHRDGFENNPAWIERLAGELLADLVAIHR